MSSERNVPMQEFSRGAILDHVDAIVDAHPVVHAVLSSIAMDFCVGRRAPIFEGDEPMQIILARIPAQGEQPRVVIIASRVLSQQWPYLVHIEEKHGHNILADEPIGDYEVATLDSVLSEADFSLGLEGPIQTFQDRFETPGRYQRWIEAMLDPTPLVDLV